MYGLPQSGKLAHNKLSTILSNYNFSTSPLTPGLWTHKTKLLNFMLYVDDFGIQYQNKQDLHFLFNFLQKHYTITIDWTGQNFCGLKLQWKYNLPNRHVILSMPNYITNLLSSINHPTPRKTISR